jgi:hypothetical protein
MILSVDLFGQTSSKQTDVLTSTVADSDPDYFWKLDPDPDPHLSVKVQIQRL